MKKLISVALILCMIFTFAACGNGEKQEEKVEVDNAIFNQHNQTHFYTPSNSVSKLAFPFKNDTVGECVVTVDFENMIDSSFNIGIGAIGSDFFNFSNYEPQNLVLDASVSSFSFKIELSTGTMETPELFREGRWVLKKTDSGHQHHLYYIFDDSENQYNLRFLINNSDTETALLYAENFVKIFNFYTPKSSGSFIDVKDADGNSASLEDYRFFCDAAAIALAKNGLVLPNSSYISSYAGKVLSLTVPVDEKQISYSIETVNDMFLDNYSEVINVFTMNNHTVHMAKTIGSSIKRYFVETDRGYIKINASYPDDITGASRQKEIFVEHFN